MSIDYIAEGTRLGIQHESFANATLELLRRYPDVEPGAAGGRSGRSKGLHVTGCRPCRRYRSDVRQALEAEAEAQAIAIMRDLEEAEREAAEFQFAYEQEAAAIEAFDELASILDNAGAVDMTALTTAYQSLSVTRSLFHGLLCTFDHEADDPSTEALDIFVGPFRA